MIEKKAHNRGKKTSSEKVAAVITAKIKNPDASLRDITKETGVNPQTVSDIQKKEMGEVLTSSDKKRDLLDVNLEIIINASEKVAGAMKNMNPEDIREAKVMQDIVETAFKQNRLLQGESTENHNVLGDVLKDIQGLNNK
ncbi:MAG: hypothetical protein GY828_03595 [Candidatus Gracilibacteria bacterium]|nr:hypothetical protein [Candidatus Gracilibacteria bacterium]